MVHNWDVIQLRILAFDDLTPISFVTIMSFELTLQQHKIYDLVFITEERYFNYTNVGLSDRKLMFMKERDAADNIFLKILKIAMSSYTVNFALLPSFLAVYMIAKQGAGMDATELPLPIEFWLPGSYSLSFYALVYFFQAVSYMWIVAITFCMIGAAFMAMRHLTTELALFAFTLEEVDALYSDGGGGRRSSIFERRPDVEGGNRDRDKRIGEHLKELIEHHCFILRRMNKTNLAVQTTSSAINQSIVFSLCMFLYCAIKAEDTVVKLKYYVQLIPTIYIIFEFNNMGQRIIDKWESVRIALLEMSWTEQSRSFKKHYVIMTLMANNPRIIKPFGIYLLNRTNFSKVINAAYSCYNLLLSFNRN